MKFLVDQNLPHGLLVILRDAGHDVIHTLDEHLERSPDEEILGRCCHEGRMLVTSDKKLTKFLVSSRATCPSVLITRDVRTMHLQSFGRLIVANLPAMVGLIEEHGNAVFTLAPSKPIRASVLPLGLPDK